MKLVFASKRVCDHNFHTIYEYDFLEMFLFEFLILTSISMYLKWKRIRHNILYQQIVLNYVLEFLAMPALFRFTWAYDLTHLQ